MFLKIINFAGSLCFLLYGMKLMSDGIQKSAGQKLQKALSFMTGNRFVGLLTGCVLTMIIQSSGATTVMLVSFVNAGLVTLEQSIGVVFGANIGTTITAWIVVLFGFNFKIEAFAIPLFGLGYLLTIIKKIKNEGVGQAMMGFGLLFIGLGWLSASFKFDPNSQFTMFMETLQGHGAFSIILAVIVGIVFTAMIHSSSAMSAIVITMAYNAIISWEFGAAIVMGSAIGSTVDAIMAAAGSCANAKRTATVHLLCNSVSVFVLLIFFQPFLAIVDFLIPGNAANGENLIYHIAMLNTAFKVLETLAFIPFTKQIAAILRKIIKDDKFEEDKTVYKLEFNNELAARSPEGCVFRAQKEITTFSENVVQMYDDLQAGLANFDNTFIEYHHPLILQLENYCDQMQEQLTAYLIKCQHLHLSDSAKDNIHLMLRLVGEMESMADGCLSISIQIKKALEKNIKFSQEDIDNLIPYFELGRQLLYFIHKNVSKIQRLTPEEYQFASELEEQIDSERSRLKRIARHRLEEGADVRAELYYMDIIRQIEKIGDRCFDAAGDLR
ncbi:Na/Pi cotransporter family protein [Treponema pectinovorum]|uniref:Na/Pi cotransporter family protein n=1 Tax=Treponema pectinovorum TaxID=164 RepID=UPI0011C7EA08|nr:Na/Pi cotransporter family protein [Treponema pectinovorum]